LSKPIMGVKDVLKPLQDVFDPRLDTYVAPSLGRVYGYIEKEYKPETEAEELMLNLYSDPDEFFSLTYITEGMEDVFNKVVDALENGSSGPIVLPSFFGGGKTHILLALLHGFRKPEAILRAEPKEIAEKLYRKVKSIVEKGRIDIVVIDGDYEKYAPRPRRPKHVGVYTIYSPWGYIGYCLGRYDVVREYDESFKAPAKDVLESLFQGKRAIILIDELLADYYRLHLNKEQRKNIMGFIKVLAGALQGKRVATIITIPARLGAQEVGLEEKGFIEVEKQYEDIKEDIENVFNILRHQLKIAIPVKLETVGGVSEIVRIIRKRIFGKSEIKIPDEVLRYYQEIYSIDKLRFPKQARDMELLRSTYPFHPTYIDTLLVHIVERRPWVFQRTRFAIQITRKVVRKLWRSNRNPDFIHIWNIDLGDPDISSAILAPLSGEKDYRVYLRKLYDAINNIDSLKHSVERVLAKDMITTIFLRTFLYEGAIGALKAYPTENEIYWMVYDRDYGVEPARLRTILNVLTGEPDVPYITEHQGKIYFTTMIDIINVLKRRVEGVRREDIYNDLKKRLGDKLIATDEEYHPFSKDNVEFITGKELVSGCRPVESSSHRVIVYLGSLDEEYARELILGYMNYRNTTVVLDVKDDDKSSFDELLEHVAWLYVLDNIKDSELEELYPDETVRKVNKSKLSVVKNNKVQKFEGSATKVFRRVWYPRGDNNVGRSEASPAKKSLLGNVRVALEKAQKLLDPDNVHLETFLRRLSEVGIDLGNEWVQVSKIWDIFLRNPRLWVADRDMVMRVLKRLYDNLEIAVMRGGRIYWKNICESETGCSSGPYPLNDFDDTDQVRLSKTVFIDFINQLLNKETEKREPSKIVKNYYVVLTDEGERKLRDLYLLYKKRGSELYKLYDILRSPRTLLLKKIEVIEKGFDLKIEPSYVEVKPNGVVEVKVSIEPVGDFSDEVTIEVDKGEVYPSRGIPPFEAIWKLTAEAEEDTYQYDIKAYHDSFSKTASLTVKVVGEYEVIVVDIGEYKPEVGDVIEEVSDIRSADTLLDLGDRLGELLGVEPIVYMEATGLEGRVKVSIEGVKLSDAESIIEVSKDYNVSGRLVFEEAEPLDSLKARRLNAMKLFLSGIKVKVRRKRT